MRLGIPDFVERAAKRCCFRLGTSASWAEEWTLAADDTQSSAAVLSSRLVSAVGATCPTGPCVPPALEP
jgi:hypothetical protein